MVISEARSSAVASAATPARSAVRSLVDRPIAPTEAATSTANRATATGFRSERAGIRSRVRNPDGKFQRDVSVSQARMDARHERTGGFSMIDGEHAARSLADRYWERLLETDPMIGTMVGDERYD